MKIWPALHTVLVPYNVLYVPRRSYLFLGSKYCSSTDSDFMPKRRHSLLLLLLTHQRKEGKELCFVFLRTYCRRIFAQLQTNHQRKTRKTNVERKKKKDLLDSAHFCLVKPKILFVLQNVQYLDNLQYYIVCCCRCGWCCNYCQHCCWY